MERSPARGKFTVFLLVDNVLLMGPMLVLLVAARSLPRDSRWPAIALGTLILIGRVGTHLSAGAILTDAYR